MFKIIQTLEEEKLRRNALCDKEEKKIAELESDKRRLETGFSQQQVTVQLVQEAANRE